MVEEKVGEGMYERRRMVKNRWGVVDGWLFMVGGRWWMVGCEWWVVSDEWWVVSGEW